MNNQALLLTGTISPSKTQKSYKSATLNIETRKLQYLKSILYYITQSNFKKNVFCDNSDYKFTNEELTIIVHLSKLYNKEVELLHFKGNFKKSDELGYGYGEGECIDYCLDNSKILKEAQTFYKITGRYIIGNINQIIDFYKEKKNVFIRFNFLQYFAVNTAFFKIEKNLYKDYFYNAKIKVNNSKNNFFETIIYSIIYKNDLFKYNCKIRLLPLRINYYDNNFTRAKIHYTVTAREELRYDKILLKLGIYTISGFDKLLYPIITPITRRNKN